MSNGEVNFANAERERIVAHRWINRHFIFVPGPQKYNLRLIPGVSPDLQFDCEHGRYRTIEALRHLVQRHGGFENLFTAEMKSEAELCRLARCNFTAAIDLIEGRYRLWVRASNGRLVIDDGPRRYLTTVGKYELETVTGAPEIQYLAKLYGERLGDELMARAVARLNERRMRSRVSIGFS